MGRLRDMPAPLVEVDSRRQVPLAKSTDVQPGEQFLVQEHAWGIALVRCAIVPDYELQRSPDAERLRRSWQQLRNGETFEMELDPESGEVSWRSRP